MALKFSVGDRVRLSPAGISYYGISSGAYVPESQGGVHGEGVVSVADENRFCPPGALPRPYCVTWDNGSFNSYREVDLVLCEASSFQSVESDEEKR